MAKNVNKKALNIVSIDPITLNSYKYSKNEIQLHKLQNSKKDSFFISYVPSKDIISATIEISRSIAEDDLQDAIEIKVYDELGLDSAIDYSITFIEMDSPDIKNRLYNVFVIDKNLINERLLPIKKETKYIDYVTGAPFLIKSLYNKSFLESEGVDCFIYFQKEDAFLAIYQDGKYLYSKSLHYSLTQINEKFSELLGERIDEEDFYKLLTTEGLKNTNLEFQKYLMQLFGEIFLYINDVIVYAKRSYDIEHIDKLYIGSEIGELLGIDEYAQSYLGLDSMQFNFSIAINSKEWYIDQIHILMILTALSYFDEKDDSLNFSPFKRPPPISKRASGKLITTFIFSLIISLAYPGYQLGYSYFLQMKIYTKSKELRDLRIKNQKIKNELAKLNKEKKLIMTKVQKESKKFEFRKRLLKEIYAKKIAYPMKALIMGELFEKTSKSGSKINNLEFKDKAFVFDIQNKSDKKITELIKDFTNLNKYKINTDKIYKDDKKNIYFSKIYIGLENE